MIKKRCQSYLFTLSVDLASLVLQKGRMGRSPRVEYEGAIYHLMSRGNRQEPVFLDDLDSRMFLELLEEACGRTGWRVHAYV